MPAHEDNCTQSTTLGEAVAAPLNAESPRFDPCVELLAGAPGSLPLHAAFSRLRRRRGLVFLDSASGDPRRFSLLAFDPLPAPAAGLPRDLEGLRAFAGSLQRVGDVEPPFFSGGFLGALAYDLGVAGEALDLPPDPWGLPRIVGGLYVDYLVRDHTEERTYLVLGQEPGDARPPVAERKRAILSELERGDTSPSPTTSGAPSEELQRLTPPREFRALIDAVRQEIARGEIYQANLSHRFLSDQRADPVDLYLALREQHPGPFLGFLRTDELALLSGSPELLLDFEPAKDERPATARTSPIKGTLPRGATRAEDDLLAAQLLASEKDRAELAMIVDLERNDLGRVARRGGVSVPPFPRLESFATVHHLIADVDAEIPATRDAWDVLAALFPGGSITGAPKLRSMELIAELEREGRGFAYGSLLMHDTRGRMLANILIRTLIWRPAAPGPVSTGSASPGSVPADSVSMGSASTQGQVTYRVGGGITWASDPAAEEAESLAKGAALARVLQGTPAPLAPLAPGAHMAPEAEQLP